MPLWYFALMRSLILTLILCVSCAAVAQERQPGTGAGDGKGGGPRVRKVRPNPKAVETISGIISAMQKAWDAADVAGYSASMADDVRFLTVTGDVLVNKSEFDQRHVELFRKYFKGSHQSAKVRETFFVRPRVAICDVDVEITGYKAVPPGVSVKPGQPLRMRTRYVLTLDSKWAIRSGQSTEIRGTAKK